MRFSAPPCLKRRRFLSYAAGPRPFTSRALAFRRGGRAVEGARLESVYTPKRCIEGSNPSLSATNLLKPQIRLCFASFYRTSH